MLKDLPGPVARPVVAGDDLPVVMGLRTHRRERVVKVGGGVVGRDDHADARHRAILPHHRGEKPAPGRPVVITEGGDAPDARRSAGLPAASPYAAPQCRSNAKNKSGTNWRRSTLIGRSCTPPGKRFGGWDEGDFFATGTASAAAIVDQMARLGHPRQRQRALDFGCGLGRMTRAFADYFDEREGVDISETMVRQAIELNAGIPGVSFAVNRATDLRQFGDRSFDFVYSAIALQHVPDRGTIEAYIGEFCRPPAPRRACCV